MWQLDWNKLAEVLTYNAKQPMIFSSGLFLFLFLGFSLIYVLLQKKDTARILFVSLFSYYFYYKSSGFYFFLLGVVTVTDFFLAGRMAVTESKWGRKGLLLLSLFVNLGLLCYFKYTNFFYEMLTPLWNGNFEPLDIFLPVGISFFTFQSLSYTIDVYRRQLQPLERLLDYVFYVSFFPQLVAGPIVRARDFIPQIREPLMVSREMFGTGVFFVVSGLFKKAVISDYISVNFVERIFDNPALYSGVENLFGIYGYALQIYCDFSGYSDMAIGIALLLGFRFPMNFNSPYKADSITDFWHRWHITLGTWMKDYLFYPLTFSGWMSKLGKFCKKRVGKVHGRAIPVCIANIIVFLVVGIWHGAAWKYIVYGLYNGLIIGISGVLASEYRRWKNKLNIDDKSNKWRIVQTIRTFILVNISWFFDRADTITQAFIMMKNAFTKWKPSQIMTIEISTSGIKYTIMSLAIVFIGCAIVFAVSFCQEKGMHVRESISKRPMIVRWGLYVVMIISLSALGVTPRLSGGFIYAQF